MESHILLSVINFSSLETKVRFSISRKDYMLCLKDLSLANKLDRFAKSDYTSSDAVAWNTYIGQIGEMLWYRFVESCGIPCYPPDFFPHSVSEYPNRTKLWGNDLILDCDLRVLNKKGNNIFFSRHTWIKTQARSQSNRFGTSFLIQKNTLTRKADPLLSKPNEKSLVLFCVIDNLLGDDFYNPPLDYKCYGNLYLSFWPWIIRGNYLDKPKKKELRNSKYAIYLDKLSKDCKLIVPAKIFDSKNIVAE